MYVFPDELRKAYESLRLPLAFFCAKDGRLVPLLVTDGLYYGSHEALLKLFSENTGLFRQTFLSPVFVTISYRVYVAGTVFSLVLVLLVRLLMRQRGVKADAQKGVQKKVKE